MGSISVPTMAIIAAAGTAVSAGVSMYEAHEQGVARANADKQRARVEAMNETQKQINMRQNMLRALASQNAGALGATGGAGTSFGANAKRQISQAQNDLAISSANSSAQVSLLDQAASNERAAGDIGGIGTLARAAPSVIGGVSAFTGK